MPITITVLAFLAIFVLGCCAGDPTANTTLAKDERSWIYYGNWCGPGHGGFQNCCGGRGCPACLAGLRQEPKVITPECLRQCPPIDIVDQMCSNHDLCTYEYDPSEIGQSGICANGNFCYCDCKLVKDLDHALCPPPDNDSHGCSSFKYWAEGYFTKLAPCFYVTQDNRLVCDHGYPLDVFCS